MSNYMADDRLVNAGLSWEETINGGQQVTDSIA